LRRRADQHQDTEPTQESGLFFSKKFLSAWGASLRVCRRGFLFWFWGRYARREDGSHGGRVRPPAYSGAHPRTLDNRTVGTYNPNMPNTRRKTDLMETLTTEQAAEQLQVSARTIRRMIERGSIEAQKLDPTAKSVYRIPSAEIKRLLGERTKPRSEPERKQ